MSSESNGRGKHFLSRDWLPVSQLLGSSFVLRAASNNESALQILRMAYRFCPERDAFLLPPGTEVTLSCLSSTPLGPQITDRLSTLGWWRLHRIPLARPESNFCFNSGSIGSYLSFMSSLLRYG